MALKARSVRRHRKNQYEGKDDADANEAGVFAVIAVDRIGHDALH